MSTSSFRFDRTPYLDLPLELKVPLFKVFATIETAHVYRDTEVIRKGMEVLQAAIPAVKASQRPAEMKKAAVDAYNVARRAPQLMKVA